MLIVPGTVSTIDDIGVTLFPAFLGALALYRKNGSLLQPAVTNLVERIENGTLCFVVASIDRAASSRIHLIVTSGGIGWIPVWVF